VCGCTRGLRSSDTLEVACDVFGVLLVTSSVGFFDPSPFRGWICSAVYRHSAVLAMETLC
jgi:hypothetical protein